MRILFAGTPEIAVPTLEALVADGVVTGILTAPDAPSGRGRSWEPSPVKARGLALGIPVWQPEKLDADFRELVASEGFDLLVSYAFGKIFGPKFLGLFSQGGLNIHPSLLPRWRGPSPLPAAILARDRETGLTVQTLALEMDAGAILAQVRRPLDGTETTETLTGWASIEAPGLVRRVLADWEGSLGSARLQDSAGVTRCALIRKEDGRIDWTLDAETLDARIRAFRPWPGAHTSWRGEKLSLWKAQPLPDREPQEKPGVVAGVDKTLGILVQTGHGLLAIQELQLPGRKALDFKSFLNGVRDFPGSLLGVEQE